MFGQQEFITLDQRQAGDELRFSRARRRARLSAILSFLRGRPNRLLPWESVRERLALGDTSYRGRQTVCIDQIVGSVNRYQDFDLAFLPRRDDLEKRWRSIARAFYDEISLPPVQLYKVGDAYFVLDGHHRISVARDEGREVVEAEVTEARSRVPVTADLDADQLEIKGEYARFLRRTCLDQLRPGQRIEFSIGGGYERLLEHIALHGHLVQEAQRRSLSTEEITCDWYDQVYSPLVRLIREKEMLREFPGRTEADLYLWIMDHQHYLQEQCGPEVDAAEAADHYAERHASQPVKRALRTAQDLLRGPDCDLLTGRKAHAGHDDTGT